MWVVIMVYNGMIVCGRVVDWVFYRIEYEISGIYDLIYGIGMVIIFFVWMKYIKNICF